MERKERMVNLMFMVEMRMLLILMIAAFIVYHVIQRAREAKRIDSVNRELNAAHQHIEDVIKSADKTPPMDEYRLKQAQEKINRIINASKKKE
jgi:exonuclease VII small subunit